MTGAQLIRLEQIVNQEVSEQGAELVDLVISGHPGNPRIRLFVDKPGGISVDDCASLSRALSQIIDREAGEINNYRLEVSSPGLDRPLKTVKDFCRHTGEMVEIVCSDAETIKHVTGRIERVSERELILIDGEERISVLINSVQKAKIKLKW